MIPIFRFALRPAASRSLVAVASSAPIQLVARCAARNVAAIAAATTTTTAVVPAQYRTFSQTFTRDNEESSAMASLDASSVENVNEGYKRPPPQDLKRSVFVGNVAMELNEADVREILSEFGEVTDIMRGIGGTHWFAYFATEEEALRVVEAANGTFVRGRQLRVQPRISGTSRQRPQSRSPRQSGVSVKSGTTREPSPTLFVGNLPYNMTDQDLNELFNKKFEYCFDVRVAIDRHTGWPRGYAHADFYTTGLAERALKKLTAAQTRMGTNLLRFDYAAFPANGLNRFQMSRQRELAKSGKTLEEYEQLTERLKREEEGESATVPECW